MMNRPGFVDLETYLSLPRDQNVWLINPLIPVAGSALIYASPKSGKSAIAIQLAQAISGGSRDWMGFPVGKLGRVLYLQLDTPRSTWALRFEDLKRHGVTFNKDLVYLADRETLVRYPLDILQPMHAKYLYELIQPLQPVAVIVDTLRKIHTGDENSSTIMSNVLANLVGAAHPAALILISHDRKPNPDIDKDIMTDHRGSGSIVAEMDAILRMTKNRLYYAGRSIEEGSIKIIKQDLDRALWWEVAPEEKNQALIDVLADPTLLTLRAKARALAPLIHKSEEAAMSQLRRAKVSMDGVLPQLVRVGDEEPRGPSTVPTQAASE